MRRLNAAAALAMMAAHAVPLAAAQTPLVTVESDMRGYLFVNGGAIGLTETAMRGALNVAFADGVALSDDERRLMQALSDGRPFVAIDPAGLRADIGPPQPAARELAGLALSPPDPAALMAPEMDRLAPLVEMQRWSDAHKAAGIAAMQIRLFALFGESPAGDLVASYMRTQWTNVASLPDAETRLAGWALLAEGCAGAYQMTLSMAEPIPAEICDWARDDRRRDALVHDGRVIP